LIKRRFVLISLTIFLYPLIHEIGHIIFAFFLGIPIIWVGYSRITVNLLSIIKTSQLINFKLSGFLLTFYPSLVVFFILWKKRSKHWLIPYIWLTISPIAARRDLFDIGRLLNTSLGLFLSSFVQVSTMLLLFALCLEMFTSREKCYLF
jgi:hypothetical protein